MRPARPDERPDAAAESRVRAALMSRNRQFGAFLIVLGAIGIWLNLKTYVPSIRAGELGPVVYPMIALWAAIAIGLVVLGARIIVTGDDPIPE